ncbi:exosome non-catalytic core subunit rrp46 [Microsporum audouinii]
MEDPFDIFPSWDMETCIGRTETGRRLEVQYADIWGILAYAQFSRNPFRAPLETSSRSMAIPTVSLTPLRFSNGSASYTSPTGEKILVSVNGPGEVSRRDVQNPEEATLEVLVKPGVGISGPGERYVEGILRGLLGRVILMRDKNMARKGVVVTLVVVENCIVDGKVDVRGGSYLSILPALLQAALLGLLSAGIPMAMIFTSCLIAISASDNLVANPSTEQIKSSKSLHVLAFSSKGNLLLNESQGSFNLQQWEDIYHLAERICRGNGTDHGDRDITIDGEAGNTLEKFIRETVEDKVREEFSWKLAAA